jgi:hypothetical protein
MYEFNLVIQSSFGPLTAEGVHAIRDNLLLFNTLSISINTVFESEDVYDLYLQEVLPLLQRAGFSGPQHGLVWQRDLYIAKLFATIIDRDVSLTILELQRIVFQKNEAQLLGKLVENNTTIHTLNLDFSTFYEFSDFDHVAYGFTKNKNILAFFMSFCNMTDCVMIALAESLVYNKTLISLTLTNNFKITHVGQDAMANMLQYNNTLRIVNIWLLSSFLKNVHNNVIEKVLNCK